MNTVSSSSASASAFAKPDTIDNFQLSCLDIIVSLSPVYVNSSPEVKKYITDLGKLLISAANVNNDSTLMVLKDAIEHVVLVYTPDMNDLIHCGTFLYDESRVNLLNEINKIIHSEVSHSFTYRYSIEEIIDKLLML